MIDQERIDSIQRPVVVYHDSCPDGITALMVCSWKWPDCTAYPARHGEPPDLDRLGGRNVVVVDFSWKRDAMLDVIEAAATCTILDHHKTAQAELDGLPDCLFDMDRSGCGLAWDTLFPGAERPTIVAYVEDRDLWRWALPRSREVNSAIASYPLDVPSLSGLASHLEMAGIVPLAQQGTAIMRFKRQVIEDVVRSGVQRATIAGHSVPWCPCPFRALTSELCGALAVGEKFAATFFDCSDGFRRVSLRSTVESDFDVSEVARLCGGGGHKHAAGFELSLSQLVPNV